MREFLFSIGRELNAWIEGLKLQNYQHLVFIALKILAILFLACIIHKIGKVLIDRFFNARIQAKIGVDARKVNTLRALAHSILKYTVYFVTGLTVLGQFVDTTSILATAGIGGLAVGFGAQSLVKDVINGFFILFEDQYAVGDFVTIGDTTGTVEEIGLRITKIRGFKGDLTIIPNGQVQKVVNYTRGNVLAVVDISVPYETDIDRVIKLIEDVAKRYAQENKNIVEQPQVLGVMDMGDSQITIRAVARTLPLKHWEVERELKKRIKEAFDENDIGVPYPRRVIIQSEKEEKQ
ncbi:mechanosensitive ion channel family protein [Caldicoprobacter algeriensis]|uniref:mechanosensitive ion channel family protein n=1 Tax=Caldicoprobacter algeriensis TaxID=699281 RepID=UPI00207974DC|nr:mechanosensitive ion channel family protein [Caldicoprobacter algeriensis]MCM8901678.1 mechanosensitive ion channel family protein [Caldicoprobacter algeriensis]